MVTLPHSVLPLYHAPSVADLDRFKDNYVSLQTEFVIHNGQNIHVITKLLQFKF